MTTIKQNKIIKEAFKRAGFNTPRYYNDLQGEGGHTPKSRAVRRRKIFKTSVRDMSMCIELNSVMRIIKAAGLSGWELYVGERVCGGSKIYTSIGIKKYEKVN